MYFKKRVLNCYLCFKLLFNATFQFHNYHFIACFTICIYLHKLGLSRISESIDIVKKIFQKRNKIRSLYIMRIKKRD